MSCPLKGPGKDSGYSLLPLRIKGAFTVVPVAGLAKKDVHELVQDDLLKLCVVK